MVLLHREVRFLSKHKLHVSYIILRPKARKTLQAKEEKVKFPQLPSKGLSTNDAVVDTCSTNVWTFEQLGMNSVYFMILFQFCCQLITYIMSLFFQCCSTVTLLIYHNLPSNIIPVSIQCKNFIAIYTYIQALPSFVLLLSYILFVPHIIYFFLQLITFITE